MLHLLKQMMYTVFGTSQCLLFNLNLSYYFSTRSFCVFGLDLRVKMCLFLLFHSDKVTIAKQTAQKWLEAQTGCEATIYTCSLRPHLHRVTSHVLGGSIFKKRKCKCIQEANPIAQTASVGGRMLERCKCTRLSKTHT